MFFLGAIMSVNNRWEDVNSHPDSWSRCYTKINKWIDLIEAKKILEIGCGKKFLRELCQMKNIEFAATDLRKHEYFNLEIRPLPVIRSEFTMALGVFELVSRINEIKSWISKYSSALIFTYRPNNSLEAINIEGRIDLGLRSDLNLEQILETISTLDE